MQCIIAPEQTSATHRFRPVPPTEPVLQCQRVAKVFTQGDIQVTALSDVSLRVKRGERVAIVGASGSGKSTLLHILSGLSHPSRGEVLVDGQNINALSPRAAGELRNRTLGFVYQFHHLLPEFTALENVAMPLRIAGVARDAALECANEMLLRVGLGARTQHKPSELSGGERQRAAVARALVTEPKCVLADEPTGNLDSKNARAIHRLLAELNQDFQTSLVVATHDMKMAKTMHRVVRIADGSIQRAKPNRVATKPKAHLRNAKNSESPPPN